MPNLRFIALGAVIAAILIGWLMWPNHRQQRTIAQHLEKAATTEPKQKTRPGVGKAAAVEPTFPLNAPAHDIQADLRLVAETIDTFRTNFPHDGNPTGSNSEITAALTGRNKVGFAFIPPQHPAINGSGELCDRWGTPFFFHSESSTRMEIRSAGPDRKLWSADDIAYSP